MTLTLALVSLAFAGPPSLSLDLDGDGKPESIVAEEEKVKIGALEWPCSGMEMCSLEAHDITSADKQREVLVCEHGPRDDRSCRLLTLKGGKLVEITFPTKYPPSKVITNSNGVVLTEEWTDRIYNKIEKYTFADGKLTVVKQPFYAAGSKWKVDRSFPIVYAPDSKTVIGNARADSEVEVILEHGERPGWYLIKFSSGIVGWATTETLVGASDQLQMMMSAG